MDRHANMLRLILAMCLTVFAVGMARADLPVTTGSQTNVRVGDPQA